MDEARLVEKLRLIEALYAGATTEGEKVAAERARLRILERLKTVERVDPPIEYRFTMRDAWSRKVLMALLRRYGIAPYRYRGQRHTTVMAKVSKRFVSETLWPEFEELAETLRSYLSEVTDRVVAEVLHKDASDATEVAANGPREADDEGSTTAAPAGEARAAGGPPRSATDPRKTEPPSPPSRPREIDPYAPCFCGSGKKHKWCCRGKAVG